MIPRGRPRAGQKMEGQIRASGATAGAGQACPGAAGAGQGQFRASGHWTRFNRPFQISSWWLSNG